MSNNKTPVDLLLMVEDDHSSDYDDYLDGWLSYHTMEWEDGSLWLRVKFLDRETDNEHIAWYEVFPDQFSVERNPRP